MGSAEAGRVQEQAGAKAAVQVAFLFLQFLLLLLLLFFFSFSMPFINKSKSSLACFTKKEYLGVTFHGYVGRVKLHG